MTLHASLERPLPRSLPVGRATGVFCTGICFDDTEPIDQLEILVDGVRHPVSAFAMVRPDAARSHGPAAARSGFWGTVPVEPRSAPGTLQFEVQPRLRGGGVARALLGTIEVALPGRAEGGPAEPEAGKIAICMATFEPKLELFRTQIESLRSQRDVRWKCLISDDCSSPERFEQIRAELDGDSRFVLSRSPTRLGFYRNFERALTLVPPGTELIALCDQDDRWHPDKLAALRGALGDAVLAYSDLRLVEAGGRVLRETLWQGRANNHTDLASMVIANTITGAASLFRRNLLDVLLPFPDAPGFQFHDHWLAVAALAAGEVAYVDRPLYDYVQHPAAVFGDVTHGEHQPASGIVARALGWLRAAPVRWRAAYMYGYLARQTQVVTLQVRCGATLTPDKRRALNRFLAAERSWLWLLWLGLRPLRALSGRTETLGSEFELARGILWKRLAQWGAGARRPPWGALAATPPPLEAFTQARLRRWRRSVRSPRPGKLPPARASTGADRL